MRYFQNCRRVSLSESERSQLTSPEIMNKIHDLVIGERGLNGLR